MDYELDVRRTPHLTIDGHDDLTVTVWFLSDDGVRTGLYLKIIDDGRVCNQDSFEEFLAIVDPATLV